MDTVSRTARIFSTVDTASFLGRSAELQRLFAHAKGESSSPGIALLAPPAAGASELLAQVYDILFFDQETVIPFYFQVRHEDVTAMAAARRFLNEFVAQTVAFRTKDSGIIGSSHDLRDLSALSSPVDSGWIDPLIDGYYLENPLDERALIRQCLSSPLRVPEAQGNVFVMVDDVQEALALSGGNAFLDDLTAAFERSRIPVVFCGLRRFLYDRTRFAHMKIGRLSFAEAGRVVEEQASRLGVAVTEQTRDLIAVQLGCRPAHISTFIKSAYEAGAELSTFSWTQQFYTDEIFGGRLSRRFNSIMDRAATDIETQTRLVQLLTDTSALDQHRSPFALWKEGLELSNAGLRSTVATLHNNEIVNFDGAEVAVDPTDSLLNDYIESRSLLGSGDRPRALVIGEAMAKNVRHAPKLMARFYRRHASLGLLDLMREFDGRQVSPAIIDYTRYKNELKGIPRERALKALIEDKSRIRLPKCVFSAQTSAYYPPLDEICESERSATAICMNENADDPEMAWIAAEIDSKLEARADVAEFWCDRLEMVAANCSFENYRIWLVATEGFDPDAMAVLGSRGAIGSSREQAELLKEMLSDASASMGKAASNVYEFVVPMGGDTEMIAAHTVEEIARRHNYPPKAINQIKTALVEACINAAEHSLSPDRRIYQTFTVDDEKMTITVGNRGLRLNDKPELANENEGRRGWGLRLISSLMDEVEFAATDDGTLITMVKYAGDLKGGAVEPNHGD